MVRPGEYLPDPTEGITDPADLPKAVVVRQSRDYRRRRCPRCRHSCYRDSRGRRRLHDLGDRRSGRPREVEVVYSQHRCERCRKYFSADLSDMAPPYGHYTVRVMALAVQVVVEDGLPYRAASWHLWRDHRVFVPWATVQNWVEAAGEKRRGVRRG